MFAFDKIKKLKPYRISHVAINTSTYVKIKKTLKETVTSGSS